MNVKQVKRGGPGGEMTILVRKEACEPTGNSKQPVNSEQLVDNIRPVFDGNGQVVDAAVKVATLT